MIDQLENDLVIASEFGVAEDAGRAEAEVSKPACPKCGGEGYTGTGAMTMTPSGPEDDTELCECQHAVDRQTAEADMIYEWQRQVDNEEKAARDEGDPGCDYDWPVNDDDPGCDFDWPDGDCPRGVKVQ